MLRDDGQLPVHHKDPFDRMLIAQAGVENLTLRVNDYGQLPEHRSADVADVARSGDRQITVRCTSSPAFLHWS